MVLNGFIEKYLSPSQLYHKDNTYRWAYKDHEFEVSLSYATRMKPTWAYVRPVSNMPSKDDIKISPPTGLFFVF